MIKTNFNGENLLFTVSAELLSKRSHVAFTEGSPEFRAISAIKDIVLKKLVKAPVEMGVLEKIAEKKIEVVPSKAPVKSFRLEVQIFGATIYMDPDLNPPTPNRHYEGLDPSFSSNSDRNGCAIQ
jgi:hypothetical protein